MAGKLTIPKQYSEMKPETFKKWFTDRFGKSHKDIKWEDAYKEIGGELPTGKKSTEK